ncbi:MAG: hypothetical protein ACK559_11515, partial [bacterium]
DLGHAELLRDHARDGVVEAVAAALGVDEEHRGGAGHRRLAGVHRDPQRAAGADSGEGRPVGVWGRGGGAGVGDGRGGAALWGAVARAQLGGVVAAQAHRHHGQRDHHDHDQGAQEGHHDAALGRTAAALAHRISSRVWAAARSSACSRVDRSCSSVCSAGPALPGSSRPSRATRASSSSSAASTTASSAWMRSTSWRR